MALFHVGFISYTLQREVDMNVIIPTPTIPESMGLGGKTPTHVHKAPFPVLYLLHGFGNNYSVWGRYTNVERYAEERQIAVVMISGENKGYQNQEGGSGRFSSGDRHFDFLSKEVPEFVKANFPVSGRPEDTYIAGLSMGSMGSLVHSLTNPEMYRAVGSFSGPLMRMDIDRSKSYTEEELAGMINPLAVELVQKAKAEGKKFPDYYISTGLKDGPDRAKAFAKFLSDNGIKVTTNFEKDYGHEWRCWEENIEEFLDWLPRTDAYAGSMRQI